MHISKIAGFLLGSLLMACIISLPLSASGSRETEKEPADSGSTVTPTEDTQDAAGAEVVATVNQAVITSDDLDREVLFMKQQYLQQGQVVEDSMLAQIQEESLEILINRELLYQESQREGVEADPSSIEENYGAYRGQFPDEETFKQSLAQVQHTPESFRKDLERGLAVQKYVDEGIGASVEISETESREFYDENPDYFVQPEQIRARHILILVEEGSDEAAQQEALQKIKEIEAAVAAGGDFEELAREHSEDPGSGAQGGDLGYFGRGQMVPPFEEAAFSLKPGQVSGIVETDYGYHLIKLLDRRAEGPVPFPEVRENIDDYLTRVQVNEEVNQLLDRLRESARITKAPAE